MKAPPSEFPLSVDRNTQIPIFLQLCERFKTAIASGHLRPGDRVPATRSLAGELGVARGTVETAYKILADEGYFLVRGAAGTVVSPQLGASQRKPPPRRRAASPPAEGIDAQGAVLPYQLGVPALDAFPRKLWNRLAARRLRATGVAGLGYPDPAGYWPLRERIAAYLGVSRGVECAPEQVFITSGYRASLDLILRVLFRADDQVWFEDPGYIHARQFLDGAGARLVPVPVDGDGLMVERGVAAAPAARLALVTPSHQSPLGVTLALERRMALLQWAGAARAWILEDDYDSEYRYLGRPLPALKSLDREDRVIYAGTFSKVLFPGLRLAYFVAPRSETEGFRRQCVERNAGCPIWFQAALADFMAEGHFARHLKKMRTLYAQRRNHTAVALRQAFGSRLRIDLQAGGMHLLAMLNHGTDDAGLAAQAREAGLPVEALSNWCIAARREPGLLLGFTNVASAAEAARLAARLEAALFPPG
jgi:GntR family transcriptional regulator/MocR family aminotransferase